MSEILSDTEIASVAARLRATSGVNSSAYKRGFVEGKVWARDDAEHDHLELLSEVDIEQELRSADSPIHAAAIVAKRMGADDAQYLFGDTRNR